ncbi:hypothetical protein K3N28_19615 [Glycomyces sp. TRM65418]|uniref:hypothetical protein n=1 Tax=Glycomyces sp. TRM65418 TaxID=2867006 RepID=UPI001CE62D46|nr:hypothetical protein [Glycomyces sp. TRM65418]MCC3765271.1 hypothetical protein [Glycomyces sp. TRM65418]QZD54892.1 hypothetical protein K3N28_19520 [Glycomyces sp. TRM65418]
MARTPVTGTDVERAVALTAETLRTAPAEAWNAQAGPMDCDCWEALDHLNNGLFSYALRLAPPVPYVEGRPTILWHRPGAHPFPITTDREAGPEARIEALLMMGGLVAAVVDTRPPAARAWHIWGVGDPEGFAAMGVVETLAHAFDLAQGLGVPFEPPADLVAPALARLFPEAPTDTDPWRTLLWATGRGGLEGHERRGPDWAWHSAPL